MKRRLKLVISLLVRAWDILHDAALSLVGLQAPPRCVVLYYHEIPAAGRASFARQMDTLVSRTCAVPASFNGSLQPGRHYSVVTFDDGFVSTMENALPECHSRRIPATIFIPSGSLGRRPAWVTRTSSPAWNETVMTADQVRELKRFNLLTIGAHSITHPDFTTLAREQADRELRQSRADLEALSGKPVDLFSFPHGKFTPETLDLAKAAGYQRVFSVRPIPVNRAPAPYVVGRVSVSADDWPLEFKLKLMGAYRWMANI